MRYVKVDPTLGISLVQRWRVHLFIIILFIIVKSEAGIRGSRLAEIGNKGTTYEQLGLPGSNESLQ